MGFGVEETEYPPEIRRRNQRLIAVMAVASVAIVVAAWALTDWPAKNAAGIAAFLLVVHACLWWMFASKRAGYLQAPTNWKQWRKTMNVE